MAAMKIEKVTIHRFMEFSHAEVDEESCNIVNCINTNHAVLQSFVSAYEFLFANKELPIADIQYAARNDASGTDDSSPTYVEAILGNRDSDEKMTLRKSATDGTYQYSIDESEVSKVHFTKTLRDLNLFYTYTSFAHAETLEKILNLSDDCRRTLLDNISSRDSIRTLYKKMESKIADYRGLLKHRNDQIKDFTADKKIEKMRVENEKKMRDAESELKEMQKEYAHFKVYHNAKNIEATENELQQMMGKIAGLIERYEQSIDAFRNECDSREETEEKMRRSYNSLKEVQQRRTEEVIEKRRRENATKMLQNQMVLLDKFEDGHYAERAQAKIVDLVNLMQRLSDENENQKGIVEAYDQMQMKFLERNPKWIRFISCQKLHQGLEKAKKNEENYRKSVDRLQRTKGTVEEDLKKMKLQLTRNKLEKTHFETEIVCQKTELRDWINVIQTYERLLAQDHFQNSPVAKLAEDLKTHFKDDIVGVLSDLIEPSTSCANQITQNCIRELLGKKADSIVVRSSASVKKCTDYIASSSHLDFDVEFIPVDAYENHPMGQEKTEIDSYIKPRVHKQAILSILKEYFKPIINCDSEKIDIFVALRKRILVTNSAWGLCVFSNVNLKSENNNFESLAKQLNEMRMADVQKRIKLEETHYQLENVNSKIEDLEFRISTSISLLNCIIQKIQNYQGEIVKIESLLSKHATAMEEVFAETKRELLEPLEHDLDETLSKFNCKDVNEFFEISSRAANFESNTRALAKAQDIYQTLIEKYSVARLREKLSNQMALLETNTDAVENQELINMLMNDAATEAANIAEEKKKHDDLLQSTQTHIAENQVLTSKINSAACDTFLTLNSALAETELNGEQMRALLTIPEDEGDSVIVDLVKRLNFDTSDLDEALKGEANVAKKAREMELALVEHKKALSTFPVLIEGNKEGLKLINRNLKELDTKINKTSKEHDDMATLFRNLRSERIENFQECLEVINAEIAKFCQITQGDENLGVLKAANETEPYLDKVQYFWRSANGEECIDESSKNYKAALAFLIGVLKYNKQNHVIFINNLGDSEIWDALQRYAESEETNLQCSILNVQPSAHEKPFHHSIVPTRTSYTILSGKHVD